MANNPMFGGIMDHKAPRKQGHFVALCGMLRFPLVFWADVPGLMVGAKLKAHAILREGFTRPLHRPAGEAPVFTD